MDRKNHPPLSLAEAESSVAAALELGRHANTRNWGTSRRIFALKIFPNSWPSWTQILIGKSKRPMMDSLLKAVANVDVRAALTYAAATTGFNLRNQAIVTVVSGWVEKDPEGAAAWRTKWKRGNSETGAYDGSQRPCGKNPEAAFALIKGMPDADTRF